MKELEKNNFFRDIVTQKPDFIVGMGNYLLQRKIMQKVDQIYADEPTLSKPAVFFFNNLNIKYPITDETWMDHIVHTNPLECENWQYYTFPNVFR